eukprot:scaffold12216_cov112-Isochrysis_galbana.AAC.4
MIEVLLGALIVLLADCRWPRLPAKRLHPLPLDKATVMLQSQGAAMSVWTKPCRQVLELRHFAGLGRGLSEQNRRPSRAWKRQAAKALRAGASNPLQ